MSTAQLADVSQSRKVLKLIGDYTGPATLLPFGLALWYYQAVENIFSFAAWGTLDLMTGLALLKSADPDDRRSATLPLTYAVMCAFVVAMIYQNGELLWTWVESVCLAGVIIGIVLWLMLNSTAAVIAFCAALGIASVPVLVSNYYHPNVWEWWMWVGCGISASIGLYLNRPWALTNIANWVFVAVSEAVTIAMLLLFLFA